LEPTNEAYALAKISGLKLIEAYRKQYGYTWISAMPTNLYGPGDNFDLHNSHVLPAMIRKFHEAKALSADSVSLWGTGTPRREFLHADDLADACLYLLAHYDGDIPLNVGTGIDLPISELAALVSKVVNFQGSIEWDSTKPDGTPKKQLDVTKANQIGWRSRVVLEAGLRSTYEWYVNSI
jgi:GDP-L-fucose synthase